VIFALLSGCGPKKMVPENIVMQKTAIESVAAHHNKVIQAKNIHAILSLFSKSTELSLFETDSDGLEASAS